MTILVHASLDKKVEMLNAKEAIERAGKHKVILPELTRYQHIRDEEGNDELFTQIKNRLTNDNIRNVENADALLILNYTHRGIENYVGGNSFLEMVLAYYLHKPIFLLNDVPYGMAYTEEIKALYPKIIYNLDFFKDN